MQFNFKAGFIALAVVLLVVIASNFGAARDEARNFLSEASGLFKETFFPQDNFTEVAFVPLNSGAEEKTAAAEEKGVSAKIFSAAAPTKVCGFDSSKARVAENVIFNEIAWMGTSAGYAKEWIEIKNTSDEPAVIAGFQILDRDEQIKIVFPDKTIVPPGGFYLLTRGDEAVPGVKTDLIYAGNLRNSDEGLKFFDGDCNLIDEASANPNWPAGDNKNKFTMERNTDGVSWHTSSVKDGTPKKENSVAVISPISSTGTAITSETAASPPTEAVITGKININIAGYEELQKITGVGPVIAQRIIDYRNANGPFRRIEDIKDVKGIGEVTLEKMRDELTL